MIYKSILLTLFCCAQIVAQSINGTNPLPETSQIRKGTLPNGMTYYLGKTDVVKGVASYYIIQNVGSVLEEENQQGLAHFLEHMAFNGTEHFEGKGILNTLQEKGLVFGKNINAYTSFDETVYKINNVPTTPDMIDTGLMILRDWSNYLLLTDDEIDAERGVIKEEWRTRQNGGRRIFQQQSPTLYNHTMYAKRMPIGKMDVVENFEYKALRDFYHDWYRTDLQAIAVVGDIDMDVMEQKIKSQFSNIPAVTHPKVRPIIKIPDNAKLMYSLAMDEEISAAQITFGIRHAKSFQVTEADLKASLLNSMVVSILSTRFRELSQKPEAPFLGFYFKYGSLSRAHNVMTCQVIPKPNQQQIAFKSALSELMRAVKFGFTSEEMDRTILQFKNYYENVISKKDEISHQDVIRNIQRNYLEGATMTDIEKEYDLAKVLFENTNPEDLHKTIQKLYTKKNRYVLVTGVKNDANLTEAQVTEILDEVEHDNTLTPYVDSMQGQTLIDASGISKGSIVSESTSQKLNATTFILSNGVKVHYKYSNKNKNEVTLKAISDGGLSLVDDADLPSANLLKNTVNFSGLGNHSATDLTKLLAGKSASTNVYLSGLTEGISGASNTKDVETLLQMVYLRFVHPRFDKKAFKVLLENVNNYVTRKSTDINQIIRDSVTIALYGKNNPKRRLIDNAYTKEIHFETVKSIYEKRFANPADFEFFIVGDTPIESLRPLLETYLASIQTYEQKEQWKDNRPVRVGKHIDKDIYIAMEDPKSSVRIGYKNPLKYSLKDAWVAKTIGDLLQLRYIETLREQEGGTYGATANSSFSKEPVPTASISVSFDCNPDKVEQLIQIVHEEIQKLAQGNISQSDLEKTLTNYLKERKESQGFNSYDMRLLTNYVLEGYDMNDPENFEKIIKGMTAKDVQALTKQILEGADTYEIVVKPLEQ